MKILREHASDIDEVYCLWWMCPSCGETEIRDIYSFCPMCGKELDWLVDANEVEEEMRRAM